MFVEIYRRSNKEFTLEISNVTRKDLIELTSQTGTTFLLTSVSFDLDKNCGKIVITPPPEIKQIKS